MAAHELLRNLSDKVDPSRAVVLTIDVQNDFFHDQGYMGRLGVPLGSIQGMVPKLQSFLAAARLAEVPVMHVVSHHESSTPRWWSPRARGRTRPDLGRPGDEGCRDLPWRAMFGVEQYEIKALPGEEIIVNHRYNAFHVPIWTSCCGPGPRRRSSSPGPAFYVCVESTAREVYSQRPSSWSSRATARPPRTTPPISTRWR